MDRKICAKCGVEKSFLDFGEHKHGKFGLKSRCEICSSSDRKIYRQSEKGIASRSLYRKNNKEKIAAKIHDHYIDNKEAYRKRNKEWQEKHRERSAAFTRKYYWSNKQKSLDRSRGAVLGLDDWYVKKCILLRVKVPFDVPQELVKLKRIQLQIKHYLKANK